MQNAGADNEVLEHAIRVLFALVQREGGTVTVSGIEAGLVNGTLECTWDDMGITIKTKEYASGPLQ